MRNFIRKITPDFVLNTFRRMKKKRRRKMLRVMAKRGEVITKEQLKKELEEIGITSGDTLLVHSSLSKIGFVEGGAQTVVDALLSVVGTTGHILMPNSPNAHFQLDYIRKLKEFDVENSKSQLGVITEVFRNHPQAKRSWHPTEPVSCIGPNAAYFIEDHYKSLTPYTSESPFYRVAVQKGKILMIGVTLANAGTSLHLLEDAIGSDFKFPIYYDETFRVKVRDPFGDIHEVETKVHNPTYSKKRKCDELIPMFEKEGALKQVKIGNANTLLFDAEKMLQVMLDNYRTEGVTMYTPKGS